jgi:hypothetical protein
VPLDARLNFPPKDSYQDRLVPLIDNEPAGGLIDVDIYRVTLARPIDALIRAAARGVRIRIYLEPMEYSNVNRPGNKIQMDRLVAAALQHPGTIEIRMRKHLGLNHQKTVWLHAQRVVVFGTSNWSDASDDNQLEANIFTDKMPGDPLNDFLFTELHKVFERKWYNQAPDGSIETEAWRTPTLPPPTPAPATTCQDPKASNFGGPLPCVYPVETTDQASVTLDKTSLLVGGAEANWVINVSASSGAGAWTAVSDAPWLVVKSTSPTPMPVTGTGLVKVRAVANTGAKRVGHVTINDAVFTVTQSASS